MAIKLKNSSDTLLYTFPDQFKLEHYHSAKRIKTVDKALQHGGDVVSDKKFELQHLSIVGTLAGISIADFETKCSELKGYIVQDNLRLYAYDSDKYFDVKGLESIDFDFLAHGGIADATILLLADPFRYYKDEDEVSSTILDSSHSFTVPNNGEIEISPVITLAGCAGLSLSEIRITNETDEDRYFEYKPAVALCNTDILEIDCKELTCKLNTVDDIAHFSGAFFNLKAGDNSIVFTGTGTCSSAVLSFTFRKRYY